MVSKGSIIWIKFLNKVRKDNPTITKIPPVAKEGTIKNNGAKGIDIKNRIPIIKEVKPDFPPDSIPAADSMYTTVVEVPKNGAKIEARLSEIKALFILITFPFFIRLALLANPVIVPTPSKKSTKNKENAIGNPIPNKVKYI